MVSCGYPSEFVERTIGMTLLSLLFVSNVRLKMIQDVLDKSTVASSGELW